MGLTTSSGDFNWANLIGGLFFGMIGLIGFMYGKRDKNPKRMAIGVVLMVYPYLVYNTFAVYALGIVLTAVLYFWR